MLDIAVKHVSHKNMNSVNIRTLRQNWPEIERRLRQEKELLITRNSKPVAKLVLVTDETAKPRGRFDFEEHRKWLKEMWPEPLEGFSTDEALSRDRDEGFSHLFK